MKKFGYLYSFGFLPFLQDRLPERQSPRPIRGHPGQDPVQAQVVLFGKMKLPKELCSTLHQRPYPAKSGYVADVKRANQVEKMTDFNVWLEFEEVDPDNWDTQNDCANVQVNLADGRQYGINVWTYKYLETAVKADRENGENIHGLYQIPPDLFVKELTRDCIEQTIASLLETGELEKVLNPTVKSEDPKT